MRKENLDKKKSESSRLDELNNQRVADSKLRMAKAAAAIAKAKAICEAKPGLDDGDVFTDGDIAVFQKSFAKAIRLAAHAKEDMGFACSHFGWNDDVCFEIDYLVAQLGAGLAAVCLDEVSVDDVYTCVDKASATAATVLATLVEWFDEDVDVGE